MKHSVELAAGWFFLMSFLKRNVWITNPPKKVWTLLHIWLVWINTLTLLIMELNTNRASWDSDDPSCTCPLTRLNNMFIFGGFCVSAHERSGRSVHAAEAILSLLVWQHYNALLSGDLLCHSHSDELAGVQPVQWPTDSTSCQTSSPSS